jgi:hypothetical protein
MIHQRNKNKIKLKRFLFKKHKFSSNKVINPHKVKVPNNNKVLQIKENNHKIKILMIT